MTVVVTTSPGFAKSGRPAEAIAQRGWEFLRCADTALPDGGVSAHLDRVEFLVVGLFPATAEQIAAMPKLKAVIKNGVGVDNIDIPAATARGIPVINAPGTNANAVAELALGGMLSLARRIPQGHMSVVGGGWSRHVGSEIAGKTLGVVGLGNIGRNLAAKAVALGMKVVATELYPDAAFVAAHGIELMSLPELLACSDYVSLHVFGGKDNAHLIGAAELALMKPTAFLLNYARGEVVDLDALVAALRAGRLGGAAIDAYETEPPDRAHPVFADPRVVFTPHSGADTGESSERCGLSVIGDIDLILAGKPSPRCLNPEVFGASADLG